MFLEGAEIPMHQRLRRFRVDLAAADATREPSYEIFESRDACLWSPNVLLRCAPPGGAAGRGVSYNETGGIRRCEQSFTQPRFPGFDIQVPLSREFNHRMVEDNVDPGAYQTPVSPGEAYERWRRAPRFHERVEHNSSEGLALPQQLPG